MSAANTVKIHNLEKRVEDLEQGLLNLTKQVGVLLEKAAAKPAPAKKVTKKAN